MTEIKEALRQWMARERRKRINRRLGPYVPRDSVRAKDAIYAGCGGSDLAVGNVTHEHPGTG